MLDFDLDLALMAVSIKAFRYVVRHRMVIELQAGVLFESKLDRVWGSRFHYVGAISVLRCIDFCVREEVDKIFTDSGVLRTQQGGGFLVGIAGAHGRFGFGRFGHRVGCVNLLVRYVGSINLLALHGIRFLIELLRSVFFRLRGLGGTGFRRGFFRRGFHRRRVLLRGFFRRGFLRRGFLRRGFFHLRR